MSTQNDECEQQFSLEVPRAGCVEFISRIGLASEPRLNYIDGGGASEDFLTRAALHQLISEAQRGDVIVRRDQSRLERDAIEVTLVVRDLVRDRACRLFEVQFANAIDQAKTFIQGTGHQMELEAIRSRTREALRSRVRDGRIAGGSCYGYRLERKTDSSGRRYTRAIVNEAESTDGPCPGRDRSAAPKRHDDIAALEADLAGVRAEQKRSPRPPPYFATVTEADLVSSTSRPQRGNTQTKPGVRMSLDFLALSSQHLP